MPASQQVPSPNTSSFAKAATPSDTINEAVPFRALWLGTGGDVSVAYADGTSAVFKNAPAGDFAHGGVRVNVTGTGAADILLVY